MTATAAGRRTIKHRPATLERRRAILQAAADTFGAKGYGNASLTAIAEATGMTHAGILHHFGSKNQLLMEVLRHRDESQVEALDGGHIPDGGGLFRHLIETAFGNAQQPGIVQTYVVLSADSVTADHPARDYFVGRYRTLRGEIVDAFHQMCAEHGVDDPANVRRAAAAILAVMDGLQVQWLLDPDDVELGAASKFAIEAIVAQVLTPREHGIPG